MVMVNEFSSIPLAPEILGRTPPEVIELLLRLLEENRVLREENHALREENRLLRQELAILRARVEELEAKLNMNSSNSSKPPSSDSPFAKRPQTPKMAKKTRKRKGVRQQCLRPTELVELHPEKCSCGCRVFEEQEPYYIHQVIELPQIQANVSHVSLYRGRCQTCGKIAKAHIPHELRTGFGPRICAIVAELAAIHGNSRRAVQDFLFSVIGIPVSQGAIQNILDRISLAIAPHYETIGETVRAAPVNHVDETTWKQGQTLEWLWLMCNSAAAFFMLHRNRSKAAFRALIQEWQGILVSDDYSVYQQWVHGRQSCLAHLIRHAKGLSERSNPALSRPGAWALKELRLLCRMAKKPPSVGQWNMFYARLIRLIGLYREQPDDLGKFVRRLQSEMDCLWLFLQENGVAPTNNHAERTLRFAVLWRKRSFGTRVEKGNSFVERILSLRQTCRLQGKRTFPVLVEAIQAYLLGNSPNVHWIQALACTTP
jgi:transposase